MKYSSFGRLVVREWLGVGDLHTQLVQRIAKAPLDDSSFGRLVVRKWLGVGDLHTQYVQRIAKAPLHAVYRPWT
jgi:hypothetical protein